VGWHGRAFVLPRETLQQAPADGEEPPERIVYQTEGPSENPFRVRGTLAGWRDKVAALCVGNSRLTFAASCAFAGPLMRPAGLDSGGMNFVGKSSTGKTTVMRIPASVYGGPSFLQRWRQTDNHLEAVAAQSCDTVLLLDELAQVDPKTAGECSYLLANETGKGRATRGGQARARLTWRLLFLSAGEIGLAAHMAEGGKRARAGQELRMVDIPAEVAPGTIFETTHHFEGGAVFALHLAKACEANYGSAGRAFLVWLVDHVDELRDRTRDEVERLAGCWVPDASSGQVHRVGRRFALVATAGELATEAGITGWPAGAATAAAQQCFQAWLGSRMGGIGSSEDANMRAQVRRFLESHGAGRFTWWHRAADDHAPNTLMRAGFRRLVTAEGKAIETNSQHQTEFGEKMQPRDGETTSVEYFILAEVFRSEVCEGFDYQAVCRVLMDADDLVPGPGGRFDHRARLPGLGMATCYRVRPSIFAAA
jgi:putative DNA primase/helicase